MSGDDFLPTTPGTQMEFTAKFRSRPCWRCRTYRRWLGLRRHWGCTPPPNLKYLR